ncbi:2'-5' RNA ligase family protein [Candidatus Nomurabacteria bacterium]|nr:2'-5' RNA ligase family protein [Candidatus Nomurabacteria bacterium]MCB9802932.1 2'-5' RNA ligase family protein [Candidatus Nomurabacteria bacterium]
MRYVIVCNLNGDVVKYHKQLVNEIAKNFNIAKPKKQNLQPHFTLKYGFETNNIKTIEKAIKDFCARNHKASVKINGFGKFRKDVIFCKVILSKKAYAIFTELLNDLKKIPKLTWNKNDGKRLKFHATIAADCEDKYTEIQKYLKGKEKNFTTYFDNITILQQQRIVDGISIWKTFKKFQIK